MKTLKRLGTLIYSKSHLFAAGAIAFVYASSMNISLAVDDWTGLGHVSVAGVQKNSLISQINYYINAVLLLMGFVAVIFIIYAGIMLITSRGNEEGLKNAKKLLINALIGFVLIVASYGIVQLVVSILSGQAPTTPTTTTTTTG